MIPCPDIIEEADRCWTTCLMERLGAPDLLDAELDDLVGALQAVSDPRSFGPLEGIVCACDRPARGRHAAGQVLRGLHHVTLYVPVEKLRRWWHAGDDVLRRHALLSMSGIRCPDVVMQVAADPSHPLQAEALGQMDCWFDSPEYEAIKIAGLSYADPKVRAAAAEVLLWDEPIVAEEPLLQATHDRVSEVAAEAANTLAYYPSLRVLRRLHELLGHADGKVREEATDSFQSIRSDLLGDVCGTDQRVAEHVRRWLQPVWSILAFTREELKPDEDNRRFARREESAEMMPLKDLLALLTDPNTSPLVLAARLRSNAWSEYDEGACRRLRPLLLTHPDQVVRDHAAWALAAWKDIDGLLQLVRDDDFCVRKTAMYSLGQLPAMTAVAALAWDHLHRHDTLGLHATETLGTFVKHADPAVAVQRLGVIAGDHGRGEGLRVAAVHHLANLGAAEAISQLAGLLKEPPAATWALHLALLGAITDLGLPAPDIGHLKGVDNCHVQAAVATFVA